MNETLILLLVKERLGIRNNARDTYLTAIINGIVTELTEEKGLKLEEDNKYHLLFVVDYAAWRFSNGEEKNSIPRHLQYRLHNLMIHSGSVVN